ncbi:DUF72 domain-containing protein [Halomonas janggokensis]|jgi:uncharacterized protein YecE (DUF72 family)|uniref:DUF72 domain-containing protein n=1 Tax=Vreelandella janggokensis TaxID=370767 RepID=A0ABT4IVP7_9GAMM|nr:MULTISPECIES: DUF72 domain-containing protein [Halomonas]MCZ0927530.1 DUF72 domain-containing protein [Halomonas janggokensis]MCZ0930038.1 DUF72 domain-containing protein [Halomonas janggokensis]QPL46114.1 DUF72 domain-containing protein [Halomonas sp. A40-4]
MTCPLYIGLPMWSNQDWSGTLYPRYAKTDLLSDYAAVFSSVEGNTTFYSGAPKPETVAGWARQAPAHFRFCFKLPASVTHDQRLTRLDEAWAFLDALAPLHDRLGPTMVQLPRDFGPDELPRLETLLAGWPTHLPCAVEVRHHDFFHKGAAEKALNRLLITYRANRVMLDVRPLFSTPANDHPGLAHAQQEKPKLPLHVLSTANHPVIRFIGHVDKAINIDYFSAWKSRLALWINQGKTPFLFVHTADNRESPMLARMFYNDLQNMTALPPLGPFANEKQSQLF